ncbi:MAG: endonuclease/exonuclease/phosphatase family protein, partial [Gammaproteobacteria bacterium]
IVLALDACCVFHVHRAINSRHRQDQLAHLHELVRTAPTPVIVAGDFNPFTGRDELCLFQQATGLRNANTRHLASYPARVPRAELDFVLVSPEIEVLDFRIPDVRLSDHRPIVCDLRVRSGVDARPDDLPLRGS